MTGTGSEIRTRDYLIAGPTLEPLDLEEVKKQRRFTATSLDTLFDMWISASREDFEEMCGLHLLTATREFALDAFPWQAEIELRRPPVQAIVGITYDTGGGATATVDPATYYLVPRVDDPPQFGPYPGRSSVALVAGASWPTAVEQADAVRIRYQCGFGDAPGAVPAIYDFALNLFVGAAHQFSESLTEKHLNQLDIRLQQVIRAAQTRDSLIPRRAWAA